MLTHDEVEQFETLLKQSPELRAEFERVQQSLHGYVEAHAVEPSPNMQDQIWGKIEKQKQTPPVIIEEENKEPDTSRNISERIEKPVPPPLVEKIETPKPLKVHKVEGNVAEVRPNLGRFKLAPWFAAASFIGMLAASYLANDYYNNWQDAEGKISSYRSDKDQLAGELEAQKTSIKQLADYNDMFRKPSIKFIELQGKPISPKSNCIICWDKESKQVIVTYANMPKPPEGKQYQLWAILDGRPVDLGVIDMKEAEKGIAHMKNLSRGQAFAITLEKAGGSESPTLEQMYLFGNI